MISLLVSFNLFYRFISLGELSFRNYASILLFKIPDLSQIYEAVYSSIVKVMTGGATGTQSISVYPNLVVNGIINL